ncbi:uncharacterized protein LOC117307451 [Asterias rubens]|uniref:uncharacterized protein LOC117307451 n=1 Tax=Asterias rubens TaxID=7604 RepID=UPI0014553F57|nr:uncharacterized protein LOC117307451 [Asterias rubens]
MIVTHSVDLPTITLPNSALSGVQLVTKEDCKGFTVYEARIPANAVVPLRSPDDTKSFHIYYCISGNGKSTAQDGDRKDVTPDTVVALSCDVTFELTVAAESGMRLFVTYCPAVDVESKSLAVVRHLSELLGTERDIDWGKGNSRRFLIKEDGFPLGLHNTWVYPKTSTRLGYQNHIEGVYYISGQVTYSWEDTSGEWVHADTKTNTENGTNYLMNIHDPHIVKSDEKDCYCICIFDPVLNGKENHTLTEDGFSGYEHSK